MRRTVETYSPPPGYHDLPFTWIYDGSALTDGQNALNQFIYIEAGYGDFFVLRRVAGIDRLVNPAGGRFQIKDRNLNFIESDPLFAQNVTDQLIAPELEYRATDNLRFDLYKVLRKNNTSGGMTQFTSQLAFQGIRRLNRVPPRPSYQWVPKSFTYVLPFTITGAAGFASLSEASEDGNGWTATAAVAGAGGNAISIQINGFGPANRPLGFTVVGNAITVDLATNVAGFVITSDSALATGANGTPAVAALVTWAAFGPSPGVGIAPDTGGVPVFLSGGGGAASFAGAVPVYQKVNDYDFEWHSLKIVYGIPLTTAAFTQLILYDQNKNRLSNQPVLDVFYNELMYYKNGALVPPLVFTKDSTIRIDIQNLQFSAPLSMTLYLVGKQRIPCAN